MIGTSFLDVHTQTGLLPKGALRVHNKALPTSQDHCGMSSYSLLQHVLGSTLAS